MQTNYRSSTDFDKSPTLKTSINCSTRSDADVVPSIANPETTLRTSYDLSLETSSMDLNDKIPILTSEVVLDDENLLWSGEVAAAADDEANIEHNSHLRKYCPEGNEDVI